MIYRCGDRAGRLDHRWMQRRKCRSRKAAVLIGHKPTARRRWARARAPPGNRR